MVEGKFSGIAGCNTGSGVTHIRERISGSCFQSVRFIRGVRSDLHRNYSGDGILLLFRIERTVQNEDYNY